jgi:hypothetical protein
MDVSNNLDNLMIARDLINYAQQAQDRRDGKKVDEKTIKEKMEADKVMLSGNVPAAQNDPKIAQQQPEETQIKLADLIAQLKGLEKQQPEQAAVQVQVNFQQTIEREASLSYSVLEKVEGLVRVSKTEAETDRYRFDFTDGSTFKITDKWSNRSTTIWGDPHVDVDDVEGNRDGDFKDMKGSDTQTTMMLQDGTRVTFNARDEGLIESVDIYKGTQHLTGIGQDSRMWSEANGLFSTAVDSKSASSSSVPMGDVVYAGGDGNDWFTSAGQLLWGKTTGPAVTSRPYAVMQFEYHEKITQSLSIEVTKQG